MGNNILNYIAIGSGHELEHFLQNQVLPSNETLLEHFLLGQPLYHHLVRGRKESIVAYIMHFPGCIGEKLVLGCESDALLVIRK